MEKQHTEHLHPPSVENTASPQAKLELLRAAMAQLEGTAPIADQPLVSTGVAGIDRLLPRGGLASGSLIEWVAAHPMVAAGTLAILTAREAQRKGGYLVVMDRLRTFYPPAAASWGVDLRRMLVIRPQSQRDELWAIDQCLRCESVAAVWVPTAHLDRRLDNQCLRRWQLAAEQSGVLGLLVRSAQARGRPCWADIQFQVSTRGGRHQDENWNLRVELLKARGGPGGQIFDFRIDANGSSTRSE